MFMESLPLATQVRKPHKPHSNKGAKITERSEQVLRRIIEWDEVFAPQLQLLLFRFFEEDKGYAKKPTGPTLSWPRTRTIIRRWLEAGWIIYRDDYYKSSSPEKVPSVCATSEIIQKLGYTVDPRPPHESFNRAHRFACNWVRLYLELWCKQNNFKCTFKSERIDKSERPGLTCYPDDWMTYGNDEVGYETVAVQTERSYKGDAEYKRLIALWSGQHYFSEGKGDEYFPESAAAKRVWYFPSFKIEARLKRIFAPAGERFVIITPQGKTLEDGSTFPY